MKIARKKLVTGPTKPGYIIDRSLIRGQEINPFGCVDVLIDTVFYKHRLYSFPVNFRWFHFTEREKDGRRFQRKERSTQKSRSKCWVAKKIGSLEKETVDPQVKVAVLNNEERGVTVIASGRDEGTLVQFLTVGGFVKSFFFFSNSFSFVSIINLIVMDLGILVPTDCLTKDDVLTMSLD